MRLTCPALVLPRKDVLTRVHSSRVQCYFWWRAWAAQMERRTCNREAPNSSSALTASWIFPCSPTVQLRAHALFLCFVLIFLASIGKPLG